MSEVEISETEIVDKFYSTLTADSAVLRAALYAFLSTPPDEGGYGWVSADDETMARLRLAIARQGIENLAHMRDR
jgi:hypothetical protein